jgi:hypothetical protein
VRGLLGRRRARRVRDDCGDEDDGDQRAMHASTCLREGAAWLRQAVCPPAGVA